ncbi:MAG: c-type cytochrome [Burkholderiales bacterium]
MTWKSAYIRFALLLPLTAFHAAGAAQPDAARGLVLYQRHCEVCHTPAIHKHSARAPITRDELRMLVDAFGRQRGLMWTRDDVEDVVEHLNTMSYRFPSDERR